MKQPLNKTRWLYYFVIILLISGLCLVFIPDTSNVHGEGVILFLLGIMLLVLGGVILIGNLIFNLIFRK